MEGFEDLLGDKELQSRFCNYGWIAEESEDVSNCNGTVEWPELRKLYGDKPIIIRCNRRGDIGGKRIGTHAIEPTVWEPLLWWLRHTTWTRKASGEGRGLKNHKMRQLCATWVEVAIAFQMQAGFKIGKTGDDLYAQTNCMRVLCQRIWKHTKHSIDGVKVSSKTYWYSSSRVPSILCLVRHRMGGLQRRPVLKIELWCAIARHIIYANRRDGDAPGIGYFFKLNPRHKIDRNERELRELKTLGEMKDLIRGKKKKYDEDTNNEENAADAPGEDKQVRSAQGGETSRCWFGHSANARRANGRVNWYKNPWPTMWYSVESGRPICSRCYHTALRQRNKGPKPELPKDYEDYPDSDFNTTKHLVRGGVRQTAEDDRNRKKKKHDAQQANGGETQDESSGNRSKQRHAHAPATPNATAKPARGTTPAQHAAARKKHCNPSGNSPQASGGSLVATEQMQEHQIRRHFASTGCDAYSSTTKINPLTCFATCTSSQSLTKTLSKTRHEKRPHLHDEPRQAPTAAKLAEKNTRTPGRSRSPALTRKHEQARRETRNECAK